jgi:hypothetical protein
MRIVVKRGSDADYTATQGSRFIAQQNFINFQGQTWEQFRTPTPQTERLW